MALNLIMAVFGLMQILGEVKFLLVKEIQFLYKKDKHSLLIRVQRNYSLSLLKAQLCGQMTRI